MAEHRRKALEPEVVPIRAISIDGKTVATLSEEANKDCQKQNPEGHSPYWLYRVARATLISSTAALCIDQEAIPAETNDMGVFASLFGKLEKTYRRTNLYEFVSTDAGFTSEANARQVDSAGKAYMMAIKGNQPELHQEAARPLHAGEPRGHARGPRERIAAVATRCRVVPLAFVRISFVASDLRWRVASVNPLPIPRGAIYPRTF